MVHTMINCVSVEMMRISDRKTIERGTSAKELIARAASAVYQSVKWYGKIAIFTGSGNNGADGYALSIILKKQMFNVTVVHVSERMHGDCAFYASEAEKCGVEVISFSELIDLHMEYDIIVDCMLGTGFVGDVRSSYYRAIEYINRSSSYVICVDINSGMNGDTGEGALVVYSDLTIAIEFVKFGQISECAGKWMKRLICVSVGIESITEDTYVCSDTEWTKLGFSKTQLDVIENGVKYIRSPKWLEVHNT